MKLRTIILSILTFAIISVSSADAYTLNVNNGSGDGNYNKNTLVGISADPAPSGKIFSQWTGTRTARLSDRYSASTIYRMPKRDATLTATYVDLPSYTLSVTSGSGDGDYQANASITVSADAPPSGQVFNEWTGSDSSRLADSTSSTTTFSMPGNNTTLIATYLALPSLTVVNGSGSGQYAENISITVTANLPADGEIFDAWTGSDADRLADPSSATTTFSMPNSDTTITATYIDDPSVVDDDDDFDGMQNEFSIVAVGVFEGQTRTVFIENIRNRTWAQFALWSHNNRNIYFIGGEVFDGAVHANSTLYFYGDPEFHSEVTSASDTFGGSTNACIFHEGFVYPVEEESLVSVDFSVLKSKASLILEGRTYITMTQTNMLVTNSREGWNNESVEIPNNAVIYIENATTGSSSTRPGDLYIEGELDGRLTFATDRDINITSHITYFDDPKVNANSDDALGLISQRDVVVKSSCPNNLEIYSHILATGTSSSTRSDGSFGVENYNSGSHRGNLIIHGGIAQDYRGAVGTFSWNGGSGTGYSKQYTYDIRFAANPPPEYPPLSNDLIPGFWRDR